MKYTYNRDRTGEVWRLSFSPYNVHVYLVVGTRRIDDDRLLHETLVIDSCGEDAIPPGSTHPLGENLAFPWPCLKFTMKRLA